MACIDVTSINNRDFISWFSLHDRRYSIILSRYHFETLKIILNLTLIIILYVKFHNVIALNISNIRKHYLIDLFLYSAISNNCLINKLPLKQQFMINPLLWKRKHFNRCTLFKYVIEVAEKQDQALRTSFLSFMTA